MVLTSHIVVGLASCGHVPWGGKRENQSALLNENV